MERNTEYTYLYTRYIPSLDFHVWLEGVIPELVPKVRYSKRCSHISEKFKMFLSQLKNTECCIKKVKIYGDKMKISYYRDMKGKKRKYIYLDVSLETIVQPSNESKQTINTEYIDKDVRYIRTYEHYIYASPELRSTPSLKDISKSI